MRTPAVYGCGTASAAPVQPLRQIAATADASAGTATWSWLLLRVHLRLDRLQPLLEPLEGIEYPLVR